MDEELALLVTATANIVAEEAASAREKASRGASLTDVLQHLYFIRDTINDLQVLLAQKPSRKSPPN